MAFYSTVFLEPYSGETTMCEDQREIPSLGEPLKISIEEAVAGYAAWHDIPEALPHCINRIIDSDEEMEFSLLKRTENGEIDRRDLYKKAKELEATGFTSEDYEITKKLRKEYERMTGGKSLGRNSVVH